jgi:hypothetical protein
MNNLSSDRHAEFIMQLIIFLMGRCESDRTMSCRHLTISCLLATLSLAATLARAQDNYEIQVYGFDLVDPGHTMVELHSNFTIDGSKTIVSISNDGSVGPVTGFDAVPQQQHQIFPAIDLNVAPQWEINFGLGVGLTGATDHLIAKMILGYRFNF